MNIPETTKIGSIYYKTLWDSDTLRFDNQIGRAHQSYGILRLTSDKNVLREYIEEVYLHEAFHHIDFTYSVFKEDDNDEAKITCLASCIRMIFTENKICFCKKKLDIPSKVKIGGFTYKVKFDKNLYNVDNHPATVENLFTVIRLDIGGKIPIQRMEFHFLWCIIKAIDYQFNVFNSVEEGNDQLDIFTNGLFQVLKDNPRICFCGGHKK